MKAKHASIEAPRRSRVTMRYSVPHATTVAVVGDFNDWNPAATPLRPAGGDRWCAVLLLDPGRYEYRLVVDGRWIDPPGAGETSANPFGTRNAVLHVWPHETTLTGL